MSGNFRYSRPVAAVFAAAAVVLLAGCTDYDVPGAGGKWPSLSDFPERSDPEEIDRRRRALIGKYGNPADALPKPVGKPAEAPAGALKVAVIQFSRAGQELDAAAMDVLEQVAAYAQQSRATVWVFGYASRKIEVAAGGAAGNPSQSLTAGRVRAVGLVLVKAGVPADRINLVSRGSADPVFLETAVAGEAGNRRVEIYFTK